MGKISERFVRRNNPAFAVPRKLVALAEQSLQGSDETSSDELDEALEQQIAKLQPAEFDKLLATVQDELAPRPDAAELDAEIQTAVEYLIHCADGPRDDDGAGNAGGTVAHLAAVGVILTGPKAAWNYVLSSAFALKAQELLRQNGCVAENAKLQFFPRILSPMAANSLYSGTEYRLTRLLASGDIRGATALVDEDLAEMLPAPAPDSEDKQLSLGVIAFTVTTPDSLVLPLTAYVDYELSCAGDANTKKDIFADSHAILAVVETGLQEFFPNAEIKFLQEPRDWRESIQECAQQQRIALAMSQLEAMARLRGPARASEVFAVSGDVSAFDATDGGLYITIYDRVTQAEAGQMRWDMLPFETLEECADEYALFLTRGGFPLLGDTSDDDASPEPEQLAPGSGKPKPHTLH